MSRVGKVPIQIPKEVKVAVNNGSVFIEGSKGKLSLDIPHGIEVETKDNKIEVRRLNNSKQSRSNHGTIRAILSNMLTGVTQSHKKDLEIRGVGYRANLQGDKIEFSVGLSHPVFFDVPKGVNVKLRKPTEIELESIDKALLGEVASRIRRIKPPEPYKGKGIRYADEVVRQKQGKSVTK